MFTYICTSGHIEPVPTAGSLSSCPTLIPVAVNGQVRGAAPCGCGVVRVPQDEGLEAAYAAGGPAAVMDLIKHRIASTSTLAAVAG